VHGPTAVLVYRGAEVPLSKVHGLAREVFGGHLRPDAEIVAHQSAPLRVDRDAKREADPLAGTVRVLHLAIPRDCDSILTMLSRHALARRLGFPDARADVGWEAFPDVALDALAVRVSETTGPTATLLRDDNLAVAAYALFARGRRVLSARYAPGESLARFDGDEVATMRLSRGDPAPAEGDIEDFPARGLSLLFGHELSLTDAERRNLLPTLWRATRPPVEGAAGMVLVEDGRFTQPGREPHEADWNRLIASARG
jgi:hypothetical protein